ncbi:hypothetical protein I6F07_31955 [Ensifer sp. IC4062]|nr:hypothetical protein [Ensifer sp. IC4062]MCA1444702.1 hypothetical protein [Ensifer sp. IC4062]
MDDSNLSLDQRRAVYKREQQAREQSRANEQNTAKWQRWVERLVERKMKAFGEQTLRFLGRRFGEEADRLKRDHQDLERRLTERIERAEGLAEGANNLRIELTRLKHDVAKLQAALERRGGK